MSTHWVSWGLVLPNYFFKTSPFSPFITAPSEEILPKPKTFNLPSKAWRGKCPKMSKKVPEFQFVCMCAAQGRLPNMGSFRAGWSKVCAHKPRYLPVAKYPKMKITLALWYYIIALASMIAGNNWHITQWPVICILHAQVPPRKPMKGSKLPKKGTILQKRVTLNAWGTISSILSGFLDSFAGFHKSPFFMCFQIWCCNQGCLERPNGQIADFCLCVVPEHTRHVFFSEIPAPTAILLGVCRASCQDFATQVFWWSEYGKACKKLGVPKGLVASPAIGEYMAGGGKQIKPFKTKPSSIKLLFWGPKFVVNHIVLAGLPQNWTDPGARVGRESLSIYPWIESSAKAGDRSKTKPLCPPSSKIQIPLSLARLPTRRFRCSLDAWVWS